MNAEEELMAALSASATRAQVNNMRAALPSLLEMNELAAQLIAARYLSLRNSGLTVEEALFLCKG